MTGRKMPWGQGRYNHRKFTQLGRVPSPRRPLQLGAREAGVTAQKLANFLGAPAFQLNRPQTQNPLRGSHSKLNILLRKIYHPAWPGLG